MDLIVVESPTKANTLSKFLGQDFEVMATMGHIKDLPKSTLGVDVKNNFKPDYVPVVKREAVIDELIKVARKAKKVFLASDPDREGEAISSHVKEILGKRANVFRISFHEITKEAVEEAISKPREIDENLVDAQTGRRVLDRLVGYELSPLLWKKVRRGLSAGRVQSVAVRLIVEKEREIEAFKSQEYWEIFCEVKRKEGKKEVFTVQLIKEEVKNVKQSETVVDELKKSEYLVSNVTKREVVKSSYPPYTTSTMSQAGARLFGWSAKRTMRAAQKLYEEGLITYHRTDSFNISQSAITRAREFIKKTYGEKYLPVSPKYYKTTSKVAQEAHEAIRPTNLNEKVEVGPDENKLYDIIFRRFVACQMAESIYDETVIDVTAGKYLLRASGQIMKFDGWRKLFPRDENSIALPDVSTNEVLQLVEIKPIQKFTEAPARFNEASLIKMLEKLGIGRPSTYAPIISTIQIRNYVEKDEGTFKPTSIGFAVNDFLVKNFPEELEYQFTAEMEGDLDNIALGKKKWADTIKKFWGPFSQKVKVVTKEAKRVKIAVEKLGRKCPDCKDGELVIRIGRFGKFISCSRFPECKHTEKYLEKTGAKCPDCKEGDVIIKRSGKGRKFFGCSRYPDCKWASWRKPTSPL